MQLPSALLDSFRSLCVMPGEFCRNPPDPYISAMEVGVELAAVKGKEGGLAHLPGGESCLLCR